MWSALILFVTIGAICNGHRTEPQSDHRSLHHRSGLRLIDLACASRCLSHSSSIRALTRAHSAYSGESLSKTTLATESIVVHRGWQANHRYISHSEHD